MLKVSSFFDRSERMVKAGQNGNRWNWVSGSSEIPLLMDLLYINIARRSFGKWHARDVKDVGCFKDRV